MKSKAPLDILKQLLFEAELEDLYDLKNHIDRPEEFSKILRNVLPMALNIKMDDHELATALYPYIERAIYTSVKDNPEPLADALFPIMGPAIRKAISEAVANLMQSINYALEQSLSFKSIKWRLQSLFSGKSYSQIALYKNLVFRVNRVFLVHNESGLLLNHVVNKDAHGKDADLISSMLKAIGDFVGDTMEVDKHEHLDTIKVGEQTILIEKGPKVLIAAVAEGIVGPEFRENLRQILESIHARYSEELFHFDGETDIFADTSLELEKCLETRINSKPTKRWPSVLFITSILLFLLFFLGYKVYRKRQIIKLRDEIESLPGIQITRFSRGNGVVHFFGLRDSDSENPANLIDDFKLKKARIVFHWENYFSLDPSLLSVKIRKRLQLSDSTQVVLSGDTAWIYPYALEDMNEGYNGRIDGIPGVNYTYMALPSSVYLRKVEVLKNTIEGFNFIFTSGSRRLNHVMISEADSLLVIINEFLSVSGKLGEKYEFEFHGFTDTLGSNTINERLSYDRAKELSDYLRMKSDNDISLEIFAHGSNYKGLDTTLQNIIPGKKVIIRIKKNQL